MGVIQHVDSVPELRIDSSSDQFRYLWPHTPLDQHAVHGKLPSHQALKEGHIQTHVAPGVVNLHHNLITFQVRIRAHILSLIFMAISWRTLLGHCVRLLAAKSHNSFLCCPSYVHCPGSTPVHTCRTTKTFLGLSCSQSALAKVTSALRSLSGRCFDKPPTLPREVYPC
jgi:hypothetical protein